MELIISCGREIFGRVKGGYDEDANFFIIFIPENICLSNEEIWRYYILLFGDIGGVGTMEYGKYVASVKECDHV